MDYSEAAWGWCRQCETMTRSASPHELVCPQCAEPIKASRNMTRAELDAADFSAWMERVHTEGKWGPSPGGAAANLRCSRAHIDMLVKAGVLEMEKYEGGGHKVIMISQRSIEKALRNKKETGSWAPRTRGDGNA